MGKNYPYSFTIEEFDDFLTNTRIDDIVYFSLDDDLDDEGKGIVIDDRTKLFQAAKLFVEENKDYQLYTQVDLDTGDMGYSAGPRIVNNLDYYIAIKAKGYGPPDNS